MVDSTMGKAKKKESAWDIAKTVIYALLIAFAFRTILFQPFSIPSGSMKSTLLIGDYLFVSKSAYGWSRHSMPFSPPLFEGRLWGAEPERGDVIVFKYPPDGRTDYIKRLIGLPGDVIEMRKGVLHVNGVAAKMERDGEFIEPLQGSARCTERRVIDGETMCVKERWIETLPGGRSNVVLNSDDNLGIYDNTGEILVPEGHYFFIGDNRDNSLDSREPRKVGFVPYENLIGRAEIIFLSTEGAFWEPWKWRFGRFMSGIE